MSTKTKLLEILEQNRGQLLSGQQLADQLSVSRAAVWKAVRALREEGCQIHAKNRLGYCLDPENDFLSEASFCANLPERWKGCPVCVLKTVDSTNSYAKIKAASGAPHGFAVLAEEQTAGRGRMGRSFFSPAHTGLYMSLVLRPQKERSDAVMLTVAAAVAVCQAIEALTPQRPQIKWVNDIYLEGRKICGILSEAVSDMESGGIDSVIVGIGVNLNASEDSFPEELRASAGFLSCRSLSRSRLAAQIAAGLLDWEERLSDPALIGEYRVRSLLLGKQIHYRQRGIDYEGLARDVNDEGNLIVEDALGQLHVLSSGEVTIGSLPH